MSDSVVVMMMTSWIARGGSTNNRNNGVARTAKPKPATACSSAAPAVVAASPAQSSRSTFSVEPACQGSYEWARFTARSARRCGEQRLPLGFGSESATETGDKGTSKGGILEIE